jgi:hypothetical protein
MPCSCLRNSIVEQTLNRWRSFFTYRLWSRPHCQRWSYSHTKGDDLSRPCTRTKAAANAAFTSTRVVILACLPATHLKGREILYVREGTPSRGSNELYQESQKSTQRARELLCRSNDDQEKHKGKAKVIGSRF